MATENRNPRSIGLDHMSTKEIIRLMNEEEQIVLRALSIAEDKIAEAADRVSTCYVTGGRIIYLGSGTSGRIATMDAAEMQPTFGIESGRFISLVSGGGRAVTEAVEDAEDNVSASIEQLNEIHAGPTDVVIGISASGATPFVLSGIRHAQQKGIWTCAIANNPQSPLLEIADLSILLDTGPEVLTGSTRLKAGTAQKLALNRISTAAMVKAGKVVENLMVDVKAKNAKLKDRCIRIIRELSTLTNEEARTLLEQNNWNIRAVLKLLDTSNSLLPEFVSSSKN